MPSLSCPQLVAAFAKPYPALTIATVMGAPLEDAPRLHEWANLIQGQFDPVKVATELPALERAATEFQEAFAFLARNMRDLELDGEPAYDTPLGIYGLDRLPVRFQAAS